MTTKTAGGVKPFRLSVISRCSIDATQARANMRTAMNYPRVEKKPRGESIAIVGGGLLRGVIKHPDWEVVAVSKAMRDRLIEANGVNLFEREYRR